jgi:hypothetical protein
MNFTISVDDKLDILKFLLIKRSSKKFSSTIDVTSSEFNKFQPNSALSVENMILFGKIIKIKVFFV